MATPATQTAKQTKPAEQVLGNGQEPDVVHPVEDDAPDAGSDDGASGPEATATEPEATSPPPKKPVGAWEPERANIAKRYRELRDQEEKPSPPEGDEIEPVGEAAEPPATAAAPAADASAGAPKVTEPPARAPTEEIELTVHGNKIKKPLSEVIADAQKYAASENLLEEAKRVLKETRELRGQGTLQHQPDAPGKQPNQPDPSQTKASPEHQPDEAQDLEQLKQIAERIQVGDADEGAQALLEVINRSKGTKPKDVDPEDLDRRVDARLAQQQAQAESTAALSRFAEKYKAIVENPLLTKAGEMALAMELAKDLESIGVTKEALDPIRNNVQVLAQEQRRLRVSGHTSLRSFDKLLDDTGEVLTRTFGNIKSSEATPQAKPVTPQSPPPRPATNDAARQERVERKRSAAQQPRATGQRMPAPSAPRPKTAYETVMEIKRQRGFPVSR